jgi:radical SAM superfamily enzyme YgiQ (UPF0313 family)
MASMKILLIYPYFIEKRLQEDDIQAPPIGLFNVAAVLKENDYDIEILNWYSIQETPDKIKETLIKKKPDLIGFSILHANRFGGIEIARTAKGINPHVKIVFGGIGATLLWEHLLQHFPEIDYIILGEGDYTLLNLVNVLGHETLNELKNVKGLAFRQDNRIIKTDDSEPIPDLNQLPQPAKHFAYNTLTSTRGCTWNCHFCGSPGFWGRKIRFRSPEHFVEEIELLYQKGIRFFYFADDTFTIKKDRVLEICRLIIQKDLAITWNAIARVSDIEGEFLSWMRKAGCAQISYGVESGSEKIRAILTKKITNTQIKTAFSLTREYGILARAYFIYGSPQESWETIQETIDLMNEIKPLSAIFYILDLYPGTEFYKRFQRTTKITDDIWLKPIEGIMYAETDPELTDELMLAFGEKLRSTFHENLSDYIDDLDLVDDKDLYSLHADFLSRLGLTFSHGDYSQIDQIKDPNSIAEKLYQKSLTYAPDHRAYLGLGILGQKKRQYEDSITILEKGLVHFPRSEHLHTCLGLSYMNLGDYRTALGHFPRNSNSEEIQSYIDICREALNRKK